MPQYSIDNLQLLTCLCSNIAYIVLFQVFSSPEYSRFTKLSCQKSARPRCPDQSWQQAHSHVPGGSALVLTAGSRAGGCQPPAPARGCAPPSGLASFKPWLRLHWRTPASPRPPRKEHACPGRPHRRSLQRSPVGFAVRAAPWWQRRRWRASE